MKKNLLFFFITVCIAVSCQKELSPDNVIPNNNNVVTTGDSCRIIRSYYYGGSGGINDSADFIYTGQKLTRVESGNADVIYSYEGDKLISMHYYEKPGNILYYIDSFQYSNDTILSKMITHDFDMYNHSDTVHSVLDFIYTGNRLNRIVTVDSYEGYPDTDTLVSDFRWENDNVESIFSSGTFWADDSIHYQYDNNPNYFNATSRYFFMTDPFFRLHVGFEPHLPYFISKNNVINYVYYTNVDYPISYETDSLHHPTLVRSGGFDYMGYKWECP